MKSIAGILMKRFFHIAMIHLTSIICITNIQAIPHPTPRQAIRQGLNAVATWLSIIEIKELIDATNRMLTTRCAIGTIPILSLIANWENFTRENFLPLLSNYTISNHKTILSINMIASLGHILVAASNMENPKNLLISLLSLASHAVRIAELRNQQTNITIKQRGNTHE